MQMFCIWNILFHLRLLHSALVCKCIFANLVKSFPHKQTEREHWGLPGRSIVSDMYIQHGDQYPV